jgi:hypothetical protein
MSGDNIVYRDGLQEKWSGDLPSSTLDIAEADSHAHPAPWRDCTPSA